MRLTRVLLGIGALLLVAAGPSMAQQIIIRAGDDGFSTPGGGATTVDLSGYPIEEVFGAPVNGSTEVSLVGESLGPGDQLRGIDTIVRRSKDIVVGTSGTGSGPLEIVALRLVSESPVSIGKDQYDVRVFLSDFSASVAPGTLSLKFSSGDGGTFNSTFNVRPKLVFTSQSDGSSTVIDCGAVPCGNGQDLAISATDVSFVRSGGPRNFQPSRLGLKMVVGGLAVDSNGDGVPDVTTQPSSNFFAGVASTTAGFVARPLPKMKPPLPTGPPPTGHIPFPPVPPYLDQVRSFPSSAN